MFKVLVVEDSSEAFALVKRALGTSVQLEWAKTQREAAAALEKKTFDLVLLDVMLPDGDGYQLCSVLQAHERWSSIPVIFLTAKNSVPDKVLGFSIGADDFISKPFDPLELKARIEAKLRKREREQLAADTITYNDLEINKATQKVFVTEDGKAEELDLTPIEFKLLVYLAGRPNIVVSRDEILDNVWGRNVHVYSRSVDTHISKLRKKLGKKGDHIVSVHGAGYRFLNELSDSEPRKLDLGPAPSTTFLQYGRLA